MVISPLRKSRIPPNHFAPKFLFHQSIEEPFKRKDTKFHEHSQYSFFYEFLKFYSKELALELSEFFRKKSTFFLDTWYIK